jgi:ABC-2 type transport system permease protein
MTRSVVGSLILKDWSLHRSLLAIYVGAGLLAIAIILVSGGGILLILGGILLIGALTGGAVHLVITSVLSERVEKTLVFVMSLPVTAGGYAKAKIVSTATMFFGLWAALAAIVAIVIYGTSFPNGLAPPVAVVLVEIAATFVVVMTAAIATESQGWTVAAIIGSIIASNIVVPIAFRMPAVADTSLTETATWSPVLPILAGQAAVVVAALALIFLVQARKRDFL